MLPRRGQTKIESTLNLLSDMLNVAHLPLPVSPDGRLPAFAEVTGFDAASAWAPPYARATSVSRRARCPLRSGQWPAQLQHNFTTTSPARLKFSRAPLSPISSTSPNRSGPTCTVGEPTRRHSGAKGGKLRITASPSITNLFCRFLSAASAGHPECGW